MSSFLTAHQHKIGHLVPAKTSTFNVYIYASRS